MKFFRGLVIVVILLLNGFVFGQANSTSGFNYSFTFVCELLHNSDYITTDHLGQVYCVVGDKVYKYDKQGKLLFTYSNKLLGKISYVDATNPLRLLLFYQEFGQIEFLDDALSVIGDAIDLQEKDLDQSTLACTSTNDQMWIYDPKDFRLVRLDRNLNISYESANINQLCSYNISPNFILEYKNWLYLNNPETGILVFDLYGAYSKTIPIKDLNVFTLENNQLIYFKENRFFIYDTKRFSELAFDLPGQIDGALDARIERVQNLLVILKEKRLDLYLIED